MRSPYNLVQEWAAERADPVWSVIVACSLLNRTHGRQVRPMVEAFFERFPTPDAVLLATDQELAERLRPLGLYNRRLRTLRHMAAEYVRGTPLDHLPGVGDYAIASVKIFVLHENDVVTDDPWLNKYLEWRRS